MAFRSVLVRSGVLLGLTGFLVATTAVGTASADALPAGTTRSAVVSWASTGPGAPNVSLQVTEESGPTNSYVFFFVNENYCDTATNTAVFLSYYASGSESNQVFTVSPNLNTAVLAAPALSVNFTEQTAPECNTNGSDLTTVASGPVNVSLIGLWHATGPETTTFPGEVVRPASATLLASTPAPLSLANLGTPSFAQISQYTAS